MYYLKLGLLYSVYYLCRPFIKLNGWCHLKIWWVKYGNYKWECDRLNCECHKGYDAQAPHDKRPDDTGHKD